MAEERKILLKLLIILNNKHTESDLDELIRSLVRLLLPVIKSQSGLYLRLSGYKPEDIALLTISSLFIRNRDGRFPILERLFNWKITEKFLNASEADFRRYLKNILNRRLQQTFSYLSSELRPERARIKREILYALKKLPGCSLKKENGRVLAILQPVTPRRQRITRLTENQSDRLLAISLDHGFGGLQIPTYFSRLMEVLQEKKLAVEVPLNTLLETYIETQKSYLLVDVGQRLFFKSGSDWPRLGQDLKSLIAEATKKNAELLNRYWLKNKINQEEKEAYLRALDDLFQDWLDGGQEKSLFTYLKKHYPRLSPQEYRKEKRKILEYLVKNSREFLRSRLKREGLALRA
ncbi:MAG: hypothetical protein ACUVRL_09865 [Candidatus Saccharicenans sp.]|uniref:hypothetical protein n=1 Tax=Candidatus Saccharicenans sp. TaxID=2819258 RepID=UPI0040491799